MANGEIKKPVVIFRKCILKGQFSRGMLLIWWNGMTTF